MALRKTGPIIGSIGPERIDRLKRLSVLLSQGGYTYAELSARFGVSVPQIHMDKKYIVENLWRLEDTEESQTKRMMRVKELEHVKRLALESYHRSRQDKEEVSTRFDKVKCEDCGGTGKLPKCKCFSCDGTGYVMEEVVRRKVEGQAGNVEYLRLAKDVVREICELEGLHKRPDMLVQHAHSHTVDAKVQHNMTLSEKYAEADPELVLAAKVALARLEESTVEGKVEKEPEDGD